MQSYIKNSIKAVFMLAFLAAAVFTVNAQDARLRFEKLNKLEASARDVVEVNIDGNLLNMAKRVLLKVNDPNSKKIGEAISGLKGIYVRVYNFEGENQYNINDVDEIRTQLNSPGWEKLANVRSKKDNQKVDVYTMFSGDIMNGMAVVLSDSKSVALVNVIGPIDIDLLVELSGHLNIPRMDIEQDKKPKN